MEVARSIETVHDTLGCLYLRKNTDHDVNSSQRQGTCVSEQGALSLEEPLGMERLDTLQDCVTLLRANQRHQFRKEFHHHYCVST